ncbi:hypothetical protein G195_004270 [Phytophthora kernoviae 00238/432]|nr:hypothetical protein G195_004270 [Phytophthora kernoviae 00238/432]
METSTADSKSEIDATFKEILEVKTDLQDKLTTAEKSEKAIQMTLTNTHEKIAQGNKSVERNTKNLAKAIEQRKEGDKVPELKQMPFYRCYTTTLRNIEKRDRGSIESKFPAFHKICLHYWGGGGRERESAYDPEFTQNADNMVNEMMKLMEINALNMIALHFRRRPHQYIRFQSVLEKSDDGIPTGKTVKWQIRVNCTHFLHKLYDMLAWMEKVVDKHPKAKGARLYSLLPVATTFQAASVKWNASTLHGLLARLLDLPEVENFLKKELNIVRARKRTESQLPFDEKTSQKNQGEVIREVFDVKQFEMRNRKFVDEIKTSGYGASMTMIRSVTTTSVVVVEKKVSKKKRKKNDGTA